MKTIKKIFDKIDKKKSINIKECHKNDIINVTDDFAKYTINIKDPLNNIIFVKTDKYFFKEGKECLFIGTFFDDYIKADKFVIGGKLDFICNDDIIRTEIIKEIYKK
jgi:hypothetical protein